MPLMGILQAHIILVARCAKYPHLTSGYARCLQRTLPENVFGRMRVKDYWFCDSFPLAEFLMESAFRVGMTHGRPARLSGFCLCAKYKGGVHVSYVAYSFLFEKSPE